MFKCLYQYRIYNKLLINSTNSNLNSISKFHTNGLACATKKYNRPPPVDLRKVGNQESSQNPKDNKAAAVVLLGIPIAAFFLGVWQVKRRAWKLDLIDYLNERTKSAPVDLPTDPKVLEDNFVEKNEYRPFKVKGHFIHSKEILITIRHDHTGTVTLPGAWVITPFKISGSDLTIIVNRGYVPYTNYSPTTREVGQVEGEVELVGLLRANEVTNSFTPDNRPPIEWHYRDINMMAKVLETAPIFLDAAKSTTIKGGPIAGQTNINVRNDHNSYIATWFTLSLLTSILWYNRFIK